MRVESTKGWKGRFEKTYYRGRFGTEACLSRSGFEVDDMYEAGEREGPVPAVEIS